VSAARILLVSNGFGEIAILESIARAISKADASAVLAHMRLVGRAGANAWPTPVGPEADMPSGGLVTYWNVPNIVRDVRAGLIGTTLRQFAFLSRQRRAYDALVAVGDVYCLAACLMFARLPAVFVATAKSELVAGHSALECHIAGAARMTFARDAATADALNRRGVRARYAGNVMMDGVSGSEIILPVDASALRIAVLPGSRADAPENASAAARRLLLVAGRAGKRVQAFFALAPAADARDIGEAISRAGVSIEPTGASSGVIGSGASSGLEVLVVRGGLGDVVRVSEIVLGQAGTGNEQAAGLGKPVIAAADEHRSPDDVGWYRMRQMRLLGQALLVLPGDDEAFATGVLALAQDPARAAAMGAAGRERMGGTGGAAAVAESALSIAKERS
jgi:uncharacterized protein (TIGR03492 family)